MMLEYTVKILQILTYLTAIFSIFFWRKKPKRAQLFNAMEAYAIELIETKKNLVQLRLHVNNLISTPSKDIPIGENYKEDLRNAKEKVEQYSTNISKIKFTSQLINFWKGKISSEALSLIDTIMINRNSIYLNTKYFINEAEKYNKEIGHSNYNQRLLSLLEEIDSEIDNTLTIIDKANEIGSDMLQDWKSFISSVVSRHR